MTTFTAITTLDDKRRAEELGDALEDITPEPTGVAVLEIEDGSGLYEVGAYFEDAPDEIALDLLAAAYGAKPFVISELPDTDWVAHVRRELAPVEAGQFFVYGSHDADKVPSDKIALLIEAAMAFGTGHHGTTLGCLRALDRLAAAGFVADNTLDIGCGTAVLAMAAAKIYPNPVLASDIDPVAVDVAAANAAANDLSDRVICIEAAGLSHPTLAAKAPFDLIFANILKGPLIMLAPEIAVASAKGGYVILSGILNEQADEIIATYTGLGYNLVNHEKIVDWSTLVLQMPA